MNQTIIVKRLPATGKIMALIPGKYNLNWPVEVTEERARELDPNFK
jgi:hypothetical protein